MIWMVIWMAMVKLSFQNTTVLGSSASLVLYILPSLLQAIANSFLYGSLEELSYFLKFQAYS